MLKRLTILATATVVALALAVPASAQESPDFGRGVIFAAGNGTATLDGQGVVRMIISGDVSITDNAGDAAVFVKARPDDPDERLARETTINLEDFEGYVRVRGSGFVIETEGAMVIYGRGSGKVTLVGQGVWHSRHRFGFWSQAGEAFSYGDA